MPDTPNQKVSLLKRRPIVFIVLLFLVGGLGGALVQWYISQWEIQTVEKKLTASGIDSLMIVYEFAYLDESSIPPKPGKFRRPTRNSKDEDAVGEIKYIEIYGGQRIGCTPSDKCSVEITEDRVPSPNPPLPHPPPQRVITIKDMGNNVISLSYEKRGFKDGPQKNFSFSNNFNIEKIVVKKGTTEVGSCTGPNCSVEVDYQ